MSPLGKFTVLAIVVPPAAVLLSGCRERVFFTCVILTLLGFVPGVVYALVHIHR